MSNKYVFNPIEADFDLVPETSDDIATEDLQVMLMGNKTFGKYTNGSIIHAKGKSAIDIIKDAITEYLNPSFSSFTSSLNLIYEVSTEISGNVTFYMQFVNIQNILPNTLIIKDITNNNNLLIDGTIQTSKIVNIGNIKKLNSGDTNQWRAYITSTNNNIISSSVLTVLWRYFTFHGSVDLFPTESNAIRNLNQLWETTNNFTIFLNKRRYTIAIVKGKSIVSIITQNNEPIKANFIKRSNTFNLILADSVTTAEYDIYDFESATIMNLTAQVILS